ncbi:MAG TPA: C40 family peptidase [Gaiellaceae bacterium]
MTAHLRFVLLVLVLAYSVAFGVEQSLGAQKRAHESHRLKRSLRRSVTTVNADTVGDRAVRFARNLLGTPYRYGGDSPSTGFDCSGFVRFVYRHFGVSLPHSSYADFDLGKRVARGSLQPGDLVFFDGVGHVGMYIGHNRFIHAPHTGTNVQVTSLSESWYSSSYDGARRLIVRPVRKLAAHAHARAKTGDSWVAAVFERSSRVRFGRAQSTS